MAPPAHWLGIDGAIGDLAALAAEAQALAQLAEHWQPLAGELAKLAADAPLDDPSQLAGYLAAHIADPPVAQVFEALNLADLHGRLLAARGRLGSAGKLLQPLAQFGPGASDGNVLLALPPVALAAAPGGMGAIGMRFDVGGQGGLGCEAGAAWPFADDGVEGGLLRLGGRGSVSTSAGLSLPLGQIGTGTAQAEASGGLALSLFFRPNAITEPYAAALFEALEALPSPLDLPALQQASNFEGLVLSCEGSARAGLTVLLGKNVDVPQVATGTVGLSADLSFQRKAQWLLSLRRVNEGLRFVLSRDDLRERDWSAGVALELDAAPLARRVHDLLTEVQGFAGPALAQIKPFLSPGTYLASHAAPLLEAAARSIVEQPELRQALLQDLSLLLGDPRDTDQERTRALAHRLGSTISDLASTRAQGLLADANTWATAIAQDLVARVPPLAAVDTDAIVARISPLLGDVARQFAGVVTSLAADPTGSQHLASELSAAGAILPVGEAPADQLLAGTRAVLDRFFAFAAKVTQAAADETRAKLSARFGWSGADAAARKFEIVGTFTEANAATANLWRSLVTGQLEPFQKILSDPALAPPGLVLSPQSSLSRFVSRQRGFAAELAVLGIDVTLASIVKGEASVTRNAAGDIAVSAKGSALRQVEGFAEGRSATFMSTWDLLMLKADAAAGTSRAMVVDVGFDHSDKDLKAEEVQDLLAGLSKQGLIAGSRVEQALAIYQQWRVKAAAEGKVRGRIGLRLRLPAKAAERMVAIGRLLAAKDNAALLAVFDLAVRHQLATGVATAKQFERDLKQAMETFTISQKADQPTAYMVALWNSNVPLLPHRDDGPRLPALAQLVPRAGALATLLRTMAQIYDAVPATGSPPQDGAWTEADYAAAEKRMVSASRSWLRLNQSFVVFFKSALHPALLAFLRLLATIEEPVPPGSSPTAGLDATIDTARSDPLFLITMREGDDGPTLPI